jgi:hypothetical protein
MPVAVSERGSNPTPTPPDQAKPTVTPTTEPIRTPDPIERTGLPSFQPGTCAPNKCHIQAFTGGLLMSAYGKTIGLFNSGQWLLVNISEQEAQAVEHFKCPNKPDLDPRVKWGFNVAYCRFYERGASLGDPFDEGGAIEGEVFKSTSLGIETDFKGWYGLNNILIKADGTWEFYEPAPEHQVPLSQEAFIIFEPNKNAFPFGEHVSMCFYLNIPAPAEAKIHNPARDIPMIFKWDSLGPNGECVVGPMSAGYGHNQVVLEALDGSSVSATFEFDVY